METCPYRVSSKCHSTGSFKGYYVGRVHVYLPWRRPGRHDALYRKYLYSHSTGIVRLTSHDAVADAVALGREMTGNDPDNLSKGEIDEYTKRKTKDV